MQMTMNLNYTMTKPDGSTLGVYNEKTTSTHLDYYVGPFETEDEAEAYADDYKKHWWMGYAGRANVKKLNDALYVYCVRWTSCD